MSLDPLYPFVLVGLATPGPNVILLMASGVRFGFRRSLPHVAGVVIGVGITAGLTGLGLGAVLVAAPGLGLALRVLAAGWILYLAWGVLRAASAPQAAARARPFALHEAVLFQWINPKVWAVALAAAAGFSRDLPPMAEALRLASAFAGLNLFVCLFYAAFGHALRPALSRPRVWRAVMSMLALLLAATAGLVLL